MSRSCAAGAALPPRTGRDNAAERLLFAGADDAPAILEAGCVTRYAELRSGVATAAANLAAAAPQPGARVGVLAENGTLFATAYLACLYAGRCAVPLPTTVEAAVLRRIVEETDMALLVVSARLAGDAVVRELAQEGLRIVESEELLAPAGETSSRPQGAAPAPAAAAVAGPGRGAAAPGGDALAALLYTSGSTGAPKGVMVSHDNICANTDDILEYLRLGADDRVMLVLPLHYCYGLSLLHTHLAAGASLVVNNGFMFPETVLDDLEERGCTGFAGVPSHYQILLRRTRFAERRFPSLRWLQQAGGRLPEPFIREIREAFPQVRLYVMYGQTEATARLSYLPPELLDSKLGSIGRGLASTILEVLGEDGTPVAPGSDEVGEIVATGPNVTRGYWRDEEETARFFHGPRLHTRDLATVDEDGYIYIVDRARDFIKSMGTRVAAREVEEVIAALPEVVEAAVVGVPDEVLGEAIAAFVVATGEVTPEAVARHCNERLPNAKVPATVEIVAELPRNEAGKVLKERLREHAATREALQ